MGEREKEREEGKEDENRGEGRSDTKDREGREMEAKRKLEIRNVERERVRADSSVRYSTHSAVQYNTVQYNTVQYSIVQYSTERYSTHSAVQYSTQSAVLTRCWVLLPPTSQHPSQPTAYDTQRARDRRRGL